MVRCYDPENLCHAPSVPFFASLIAFPFFATDYNLEKKILIFVLALSQHDLLICTHMCIKSKN